MVTRIFRRIYTAVLSYVGGVMATPRKRSESRSPNGVIIVKGVAPEPGTKLTPERISKNLRSLNRSWGKKKK